MNKSLSFQQVIMIKTSKCTNKQCKYYDCISNIQRQKHYRPVFIKDKFAFSCFYYHTQYDRRRQVMKIKNNHEKYFVDELIYSQVYMIHSKVNKQLKATNNSNNNIKQNLHKQNILSTSCINFIQFLYHPSIYKTISCINFNNCDYMYCPYLHQDQELNPKLLSQLIKFRQHKIINPQTHIRQKQLFQNKIINLIVLRNNSSLEKIKHKEKIIKQININEVKQNQNHLQKQNILQEEIYQNNINNRKEQQRQQKNEDILLINKMKERISSLAQNYLTIQRQKNKQHQSRKISTPLSTNIFGQPNPISSRSLTSHHSQLHSYSYFNYGQRLPLLQGRQIQFKHFKDITDPSHIPLIMKYVCAFLNTEGGKLYIGIDDSSYVYGTKVRQTDYDKLLLNIDREGKFNLNPPLMPQKYQIKRIPILNQKKINNNNNNNINKNNNNNNNNNNNSINNNINKSNIQRYVIQITVYPSNQSNRKLFLYNRQCYMRMNASTHKLNASDLIEYFSLNNYSNYNIQDQNQYYYYQNQYNSNVNLNTQYHNNQIVEESNRQVKEQNQSKVHENNLMKNIRKKSQDNSINMNNSINKYQQNKKNVNKYQQNKIHVNKYQQNKKDKSIETRNKQKQAQLIQLNQILKIKSLEQLLQIKKKYQSQLQTIKYYCTQKQRQLR